MDLLEYKKKRSFEHTPEPEGVPYTSKHQALRFVIQKHRARRLHYDFRLEIDDVMKSWAVPKGPSLDPNEKRLAMMVEDHPLEYQDFEGVIPKGNYGAGEVLIWDKGVYIAANSKSAEDSEKLLREGLEAGHIVFVLNGTKLKGEFALVKLKRSTEPNAWLLIKAKDKYANSKEVLDEDRSVVSGRDLAEIKITSAAEGKFWAHSTSVDLSQHGVPKTDMPHHIRPMLATPVAEPFDREGWLFEIKWDGYRAIAEKSGASIALYTRNALSLRERYTPITEALKSFDHEVVLDGEVVVLDDQGRSRFQLLQDYNTNQTGTLVYYVFDLLYLDGYDLRQLPLVQRKEVLEHILPVIPTFRYSAHVKTKGIAFFKTARQHGVEGILAKDAGSPYKEGRTQYWLKIKIEHRQEAVICGYTEPRGSRSFFGALVLGVYEGGELVYIGHAGSGFDERILETLRTKMKPLERKDSPFSEPPTTNMPVTWLDPELVCEIKFSEWTNDGVMRHPVFLGLREDKMPHEVKREME